MNTSPHITILARREGEEFVGRESELAELREHSAGGGRRRGLHLRGAPRCGTTELLLQAFDDAFRSPGGAVPVYFSFAGGDRDPSAAGRKFVTDMLTQFVAYRLRDPMIIHAAPSLNELSTLAPAADIGIIDELIRLVEKAPENADERSYLRSCFGAPLRAAARGVRTFVMLDDLHSVASPGRAAEMAAAVVESLDKSGSRYVVGTRRRFGHEPFELETMDLDPLEMEATASLFERAAAPTQTTGSVCDLAALRSVGDLSAIHAMAAAAGKGEQLETFRAFEMLYTEAVFGGRLSQTYERILRNICGTVETEAMVSRLLYELVLLSPDSAEVSAWRQKLDLNGSELDEIVTRLNEEELIRLSANRVEAMADNRIFSDYLRIRSRLESGRESRAAVFADTLAANIKRAPAEMAEHYRKGSLIGLRELMSSFNSNAVPAALIDYARFKAKYKGLSDTEIVERLSSDDEKVALPQIIFSAHTETFYRAIGLITERERSAVAVGFEQGDLGGENQTAWIAAEIDSKLEVPAEVAQSWCDRLEMAAAVSGFVNFRVWLVAPEGFTEDAMRLLSQRGAHGSSRRQTELLSRELKDPWTSGPGVGESEGKVEEYEIVIPMGGDAEMVAAHTVEDIARRHDMSAKAINQIKTALVEACINATEHSHSPDRKIHQRFVVRPGSITITVSNRGVRLTDQVQTVEPDEGRRGWGLKLMRNLMDDVRVEQVDDGTRISMTKNF